MTDASAPYPHGPLERLDDGLWHVEGTWKSSPLKRRMTVMRLPGGLLALHSAMSLEPSVRDELEALGSPRVLLVPNALHGSEAGGWAQRHPGARVIVPDEARASLSAQLPRIDGTAELDWPGECKGVIERETLRGTRFAEVAFLHVPSRTLVLTDLAFNLRAGDLPAIARAIFRINGAVDRFGPTRLARLAFISDRAALRRSLDRVLAWDFDRIVVSHGHVLERGGREELTRAFAFLAPG